MPLTTQEQDVVLNVADCQHERPVGATSCVPLTTQEQDVVLNAAVCQHESPVGAAGWVPVTSQEQLVVLNTAVCQHESPDGCAGIGVTVTVAEPVPEPVMPPNTDTIEYVDVALGLTAILNGLVPVAV